MKRWHFADMLAIGQKLFVKIHKQKHYANPNHDVHFMARDLNQWLVSGVQSLIDGSYSPRHLKRHYFPDEMVDQLHLSDRILQHILLKQLKPTFPHVINPNCLHLHGPSGVKIATKRIQTVLKEQNPCYVIRADIKSFYKSIPHHQLIQDIKSHYLDKQVQHMLKEIIINPIETPRGCKNPDHGIALRGPLSQFFSGIYLKPLDDAFDTMDVTYLRYQDDVLILCKSKRQLNRAKARLIRVLKERRLKLSRKKTRIGTVDTGFHFLGIHYIHYPGTQTQDNTSMTQGHDKAAIPVRCDDNTASLGGVNTSRNKSSCSELQRMAPHPRTLRKARAQVKLMVEDGVSPRKITGYLHRWVMWWVRTTENWHYHELLEWFLNVCWDFEPAAYAARLRTRAPFKITKDHGLVTEVPGNHATA